MISGTPPPPPHASARRRRLLATDLDGTFIGDDEAMHRLWSDLDGAGVVVAFSTGRHIPSIEAFYARCGTSLRAEFCVCMVGTEVWHHTDGGYDRDVLWSRTIAEGWDREAVETVVRSIPEARIQAEEWQSEFKVSYFLEQNAPARLEELTRTLDRRGLDAKVIYSGEKFLDLLPLRAGKGEAVRFLARSVGLSAADVITAGDSGNDIDMMRPELGFRSIAVGNSAGELASFDPPNVFHASQHYAHGIREGLVHYGWLDD